MEIIIPWGLLLLLVLIKAIHKIVIIRRCNKKEELSEKDKWDLGIYQAQYSIGIKNRAD